MPPYRRFKKTRNIANKVARVASAYPRTARAIGGVARRNAYALAATTAGAIGGYAYSKYKKVKSSLHQKARPNIEGHGSGGTFSTYTMKKAMPRYLVPLKKTGASNFVYSNQSGRLTAPVGQQQNFSTSFDFNSVDIANLTSGSINKTFKTLLESVTENTIFRNQDANDCYMTLYDIVSRRDLNSSVTNDLTPSSCFYNAMADTGASSLMALQVGVTPFSCPRFCELYQVMKVTHIILPAGATHEHRVHYEPNRLFNSEIAQDAQNIKGLTRWTMAVLYGAPINDSTTLTQVATGACNVDYVLTKQYKYTYLLDATTNNTYSTLLPTAFTVAGKVFQDESGTAVVDNSA